MRVDEYDWLTTRVAWRRPGFAQVLVAALVAGALGCARPTRPGSAAPPSADAAPGAAREAGFAGCRHLRAGAVCELADGRELRLWVADGAPVHLEADTGVLALPPGTRTAGGTRYRLALPAGLSWIELREGDPARVLMRLSVREVAEHPALVRARGQRAAGDVAGAEASLKSALGALPGEEQDRAQALLARLALARGQPGPAVDGLRASLASARAAGRISEAVDDACTLAFALAVHQLRFTEARAVLDGVAPLVSGYPEGRARVWYSGAQIRANSGDTRGALREFRLAAERAAQLGMSRDEAAARQEVADTLARLGRVDEALAMQRALVAAAGSHGPATDPCLRAEPLIALSWYAILALQAASREGRAAPAGDAGVTLAQARSALAGCTDSFSLQVALTNEALYALQIGDLGQARDRLRQLRRARGQRAQNLAVWEAEVDARLALAEGRFARALDRLQRQEDLARASADGDGLFRALVGQGRALRALGRTAAAADRYRQAEETLAHALLEVPLGEGKESFAGTRGESARQLVTALLDSGDPAGALRAARLARARVLGAATQPQRIDELPPARRAQWEALVARYQQARHELDAQAAVDRWRPSDQREALSRERQRRLGEIGALADQLARVLEDDAGGGARAVALRPPDDGELLIAYFPLADGWIGLAATGNRVQARRLGSVPADAPAADLSRQLLAPFAAELTAARALRLLPYGALERVDLHALPFGDGALADLLPVAYGVDVARARAPASEGQPAGEGGRPAPGQALLVADPDFSLPGTRVEVEVVRPLIAARGFDVQVLRGERASRSIILEALSRSRLFHFAGHGWFSGIDGIDSALGVTQGERILLGDIMTLSRSPDLVVLSACDAARAGGGPPGAGSPAGWGIAQAFLFAGARAVLAPGRAVLDDAAATFMRAFYGALPVRLDARTIGASVAQAARVAQHASRAGGAIDAAVSFRVLVP